jgi:hypothetical protein
MSHRLHVCLCVSVSASGNLPARVLTEKGHKPTLNTSILSTYPSFRKEIIGMKVQNASAAAGFYFQFIQHFIFCR